jgi:hypothetical protein
LPATSVAGGHASLCPPDSKQETIMRNIILGTGAVAALAALSLSPASAFPVAPLGATASPVEQVRLVCNEWGRCWRTGPRYYRYGYYGGPYHRPYYGPRYGYYSPGVSVGGPGFGLRFGF